MIYLAYFPFVTFEVDKNRAPSVHFGGLENGFTKSPETYFCSLEVLLRPMLALTVTQQKSFGAFCARLIAEAALAALFSFRVLAEFYHKTTASTERSRTTSPAKNLRTQRGVVKGGQ